MIRKTSSKGYIKKNISKNINLKLNVEAIELTKEFILINSNEKLKYTTKYKNVSLGRIRSHYRAIFKKANKYEQTKMIDLFLSYGLQKNYLENEFGLDQENTIKKIELLIECKINSIVIPDKKDFRYKGHRISSFLEKMRVKYNQESADETIDFLIKNYEKFKENIQGNNELINKICPNCKINFQTKYEFKVFCSKKCKDSNYKKILWQKIKKEKTLIIYCDICKKEFKSSDSRIIYCEDCKNIASKQKEKIWQEKNEEQYITRKKIYSQKISTKIKKQKDYLEVNNNTKEESIQNGVYKTPYDLEEDNFILANWDKLTKKEIALALNRTYASVHSRYKKIKR